MLKPKFELKISLAYLIIGGLWILFSDKVLYLLMKDGEILTKIQTYKGWFYVTATALILYFFLEKHLGRLRTTENELENHRKNLQKLVIERTEELDTAIEALKTSNEKLYSKNVIINHQNKELKETLQHLTQAQAQLVQSEKMASLGLLTAGVAHEINNPLNYIQASLFAIEENINYKQEQETLQKNLHTLLAAMKMGVKKVSSIVKALNAFSRNKKLIKDTCNIHEIIDNCLVLLEHELRNKCAITKNFTDSPFTLYGNEDNLHQVFTNLIMNSTQSIKSNGEISISTFIEKEKDQLAVAITDNGEGISKENLPKIFDPFFTTKDPGKGVGIGLSIVYKIIEDHDGSINYKSEPELGTEVTVLLPVKL